MPFKCSVRGCRSNYDSTNERVSVFQFPPDQSLRNLWLKSVQINSKLTNSSRVCIKHFSPDDIEGSNGRRKILKPSAVPFTEEICQSLETEAPEEEIKLDAIDRIEGFEQFCEGVEEGQEIITQKWHIYSHQRGICFYRLSQPDESMQDVILTYKIVINRNLQVKVFKEDVEASSEELEWIIKNCQLETWTQFNSMIEHYQHEPEIAPKQNDTKILQKAYQMMDLILREELKDKIDSVKNLLAEIYDEIKHFDTEYLHEEAIQEEFLDLDLLESENQFQNKNEPEVTSDALMESDIIEYDPFKCENCLIVLKSYNGFRSHQQTCTKPLPNIKNSKPEPAVGDAHKKSLSSSANFHEPEQEIITETSSRNDKSVQMKLKPHKCNTCGKAFSSTTLRNEHEKTHSKNVNLQKYLKIVEGCPRYSCPKCSSNFESSHHLKRHIENKCRKPQKKRVYRYPCLTCKKNFTTKIQAAQHLLKVHQTEIENVEKFCFSCNREFEDYVNHVRVHSCNFSCRFCGAKFLTQEKVLKHEESKHANETEEDRPFKCSDESCGLSFKNINHLKSHQLAIHSQSEREFKCSHCEKRFALRSLLTAHIRSHIKGFAMFPCSLCQRRFKKLNNLKEHSLRDHGIDSIYLCDFNGCGERFKMLNELKHHRDKEHGEIFNVHKYFEKIQP